MKKFLLCFCVLLLIFALSSCADADAGEETPRIVTPTGDAEAAGLKFTSREDGTYAVSVGSLGNRSEITIPATYNGKA